MANYREIVRRFPAVRSYLENRRWVRRADVTAYAPNVACPEFSTDPFGFRHTAFEGRTIGLEAAFSGEPYALVLGASNAFGFGLPSNADTIASRLSGLTGLPCLNVSFPEADIRTLHSAAARILSRAPRLPAFVVLLVGGTFTRFCYGRRCDPLFGPPDFLADLSGEAATSPGRDDDEAAAFGALLDFTGFWNDQFAVTLGDVPLVIQTETSAFEKSTLDDNERACELTSPATEGETTRFSAHRARYGAFRAFWLASGEGRARLACTEADALSFIDEFHCTPGGAERIAADLAAAVAKAERRP